MAKLRHVALAVQDVERAAKFYEEVFEMKRVGETKSSLADGVYLTDGVITMAILKYKSDKVAGHKKEESRVNHVGFQVDDLESSSAKIKSKGGAFFLDLPQDKDSLYFERKFRDPEGIVFDISQKGWAK